MLTVPTSSLLMWLCFVLKKRRDLPWCEVLSDEPRCQWSYHNHATARSHKKTQPTDQQRTRASKTEEGRRGGVWASMVTQQW